MLGLFKPGKPKRIVVKAYGRDSLLGLLSPLLGMFMASLGLRVRLKPEAVVLAEMEKDAEVMRKRGYRIASAEHYEIAQFGVVWQKVTYELIEPPL
jgi:hypothetical protein